MDTEITRRKFLKSQGLFLIALDRISRSPEGSRATQRKIEASYKKNRYKLQNQFAMLESTANIDGNNFVRVVREGKYFRPKNNGRKSKLAGETLDLMRK